MPVSHNRADYPDTAKLIAAMVKVFGSSTDDLWEKFFANYEQGVRDRAEHLRKVASGEFKPEKRTRLHLKARQ
jgi:hypothetical protein